MPFNIKRAGVFTVPASGTVKIMANNVGTVGLNTVDRIYVASGGAWVDSGYRGRPEVITTGAVSSAGNGDTKTVTFTWTSPTGGATPATFEFTVWNASYAQVAVVSVNYNALTTTYSQSFNFGSAPYSGTAGSVFYVRLLAKTASGVTSSDGPVWSVTLGTSSVNQTLYGYSTTATWVKPTVLQVSSSEGGAGSNMIDNNYNTFWGSVSHSSDSSSYEWEGAMFGPPATIPAGADGSAPQLYGLRFKTNHFYGLVYVGVGAGTSSATATWYGTQVIEAPIAVQFPAPTAYPGGPTTWYNASGKRYLKYYPLDGSGVSTLPVLTDTVNNTTWFFSDLIPDGGSRLLLNSNMYFHLVFGPRFNNVYGANLYGVNVLEVELGYYPKVVTGTSTNSAATPNTVASLNSASFPIPVPPS